MVEPAGAPEKQYMSYEERLERAFERAREERLTCIQVDTQTYAVPSRKELPGDWRYIRQDGANLLCNCPAAEYQNPCTHLCTVLLALAGELPMRTTPMARRHTHIDDMPRCKACGQPSPRAATGGFCTTCEIEQLYPE